MQELHGGCHCGTITYVLNWPMEAGLAARRCACSFCTRQGGRYASHPDAGLSVRVADRDSVSRYRFGTKTADFWFCSNCGTFVFVTSEIDGHVFAVVNVNSLDDVSSCVDADIETKNFDGESSDQRLSRRVRNWIANVTMANGLPQRA